MAIEFSRMKPRKSYEYVVEQIQDAICDGALGPGETLPSEMKLKEMFSTSRGTVREALRVLEQKGLVSVTTGVKGGARVKAANTDAMKDSMDLLIRHKKVSLDHLAGFRSLLEGHAAKAAADQKGDLGELTGIMAQIRDLSGEGPGDWEAFHRLDAKFHMALARMAGNPLVEANLETIHRNIHAYFSQYLPFSKALFDRDVKDLEGILTAVAKGEGQKACDLARAHVDRFTKVMAEELGKA